VALAAVALLAGCGGEDAGGDRDAYVRDGERICADYEAEIAKLPQPEKLSDIGRYIATATPLLEDTVKRIEALDPPGDLRDEYDEFRGAARQTLDRAALLQQAATGGDSAEVERLLEEAAAASARRVELARAAGLERCAQI
jgi:hypothetical protein